MRILTSLLLLLLLTACGGDSTQQESKKPAKDTSNESKFTAFELEHGIGPIKQEVILGDLNPALAATGQNIFNMKCASCHQMDSRFVGPPLGDVTNRRSPAFTMNFMLNPSEMARQHPEGKKLLAEYLTPMPFQNVSEEDARALLEYLRSAADK